MENPQARVRYVNKHDGFILIGKDLSFYKPNTSELFIKKHLVIKKMKCSFYKGIRAFWKKENLVEVKFGRLGSFGVSQVFVNNGLREEWPREDFKAIRKMFVTAVDHAISKLSHETRQIILGDGRKTYHDVLSRPSRFQTLQINVPMSEVTLFGIEMNRKLDSLLLADARWAPIATSFSAIYQFGQNADLESLEGHLGQFDLSAATEYVVHLRRDYSAVENGAGVFWKRETVRSKMESGPDEEYYPGLISQYGNFYFYNDKIARPDLSVALTKFYTNLFSGVHKMRNKHKRPFSVPFVTKFLSNKLSNQEKEDLDFETITQFAKDQTDTLPDVVARLELVVTNRRPRVFSLQDMVQKFMNELNEKRYNELPACLEMHDVRLCTTEAVHSCSNTLQHLLNRKRQHVVQIYVPSKRKCCDLEEKKSFINNILF